MKVYQCFHKFSPHIPIFEEENKVNETDYSFAELRHLLLEDGYSSSYILKPAYQKDNPDYFFTIWDYKRLQFKWAEEKGLHTHDLDEIKLAQLEEFKPDIFYNHSPYYDQSFIDKVRQMPFMKVCWDAIISPLPSLHPGYDIRFSLFEPFVRYWNQKNLKAYILPPAFDPSWEAMHNTERDIDILFYGQYNRFYFSGRNKILSDLIRFAKKRGYKFHLHLMYRNQRVPLIQTRGWNRLTRIIPDPPRIIRNYALPPIHARELYRTIGRSKIVVNAFGNFNGLFLDNMRNYEAIGCGALLISQDGIYPEHFNQATDFLTFRNSQELFEKIDQVLASPDQGRDMAIRAFNKLKTCYSKEVQWNSFVSSVNGRS